jgi:hypothetical protein
MIFGFNDYMSDGSNSRKVAYCRDELGCTAVEFGFHSGENYKELHTYIQSLSLEAFERVSIHAPCHKRYDRNDATEQLLAQVASLVDVTAAEYVVLHPDVIDDWDMVIESGIPFAVENMDCKKEFGRTVDDMVWIHERTGFPVVIDLNHCKSNDATMDLADDFLEAFRGNIVEFHLSGYKMYHEPLYMTKQTDIIERIDTSIPIIVESSMEDLAGVHEEFEYIMNFLA